MARIIRLPQADKEEETQQALTPAMIETLRRALHKQNHHLLFGPKDIDGSATALINRGLIKNRKAIINGKEELEWYVTKEAVDLLKKQNASN